LGKIPSRNVPGEQSDAEEWQEKGESTDEQRRPPLPAQERRVYLCAGEEGEHDPGKRAQEIDPGGGVHAQDVAREYT
jgi:hypothetical protein